MTTIRLITKIMAPKERVFNAARDISLHSKSASQTKEKAIAGRTSGLIEKGETVTWRGKHFGLWLKHTSHIPEMEKSSFFVDEMTKGKFKSFRHEHYFRESDEITVMIDFLQYETPFGSIGRLFDRMLLKRHLTRFLQTRNAFLKSHAEQQASDPPENRNGLGPE